MYYGRQPEMGSFAHSLAASDTSDALPDVEIPQNDLMKIRRALAKIHTKKATVQPNTPAQQPQQSVGPAPVQPVSLPPAQPQQPAQAPMPKSSISSLADRLKQRRQGQ